MTGEVRWGQGRDGYWHRILACNDRQMDTACGLDGLEAVRYETPRGRDRPGHAVCDYCEE